MTQITEVITLFTTEEMRSGIRANKEGKTTGPYSFYLEFLKLIYDNETQYLRNFIKSTKCKRVRWIYNWMSQLFKTKKCEHLIRTQFGFHSIGRCPVHVCLVDYQTAFNRVKLGKLILLLEDIGDIAIEVIIEIIKIWESQ